MSEEANSLDCEIRRELRRQVRIAGGVRAVSGRLGIHENTLHGWIKEPRRLRVTDLDRALTEGCGRPSWAVVEVIGRACQAAGGRLASIRWGGGLFFGPAPEECDPGNPRGLILPAEIDPMKEPADD